MISTLERTCIKFACTAIHDAAKDRLPCSLSWTGRLRAPIFIWHTNSGSASSFVIKLAAERPSRLVQYTYASAAYRAAFGLGGNAASVIVPPRRSTASLIARSQLSRYRPSRKERRAASSAALRPKYREADRAVALLLAGIAEFERELIRERTGEGRKRPMTNDVRFRRKPKLTEHQRQEAIARRANGETLVMIAPSCAVSASAPA